MLQLGLVEGRYIIQVQLNDYNNPDQRLATSCNPPGGFECVFGVCCDGGLGARISGDRRCDTFFVYCLRPLSTGSQLGCGSGSGRVIRSDVNENDATLDSSQSTVLGLSNPFTLPGLTNNWNMSAESN